jgi:adenosylhomocysteine nucleosidase
MFGSLKAIFAILLLLTTPIYSTDAVGTWKAQAKDIIRSKKSSLVIGVMSAHPRESEGLFQLMKKGVKTTQKGQRTFHRGNLWGFETVLATSRIGKVAAATTVTHLINEHKVDLILFIGVAGGVDKNLRIGDVVVANKLIQHDLDSRPLAPQFAIPLLGVTELIPDPFLCEIALKAASQFVTIDLHKAIDSQILANIIPQTPQVQAGLIASGDQFISKKSQAENLQFLLPQLLCVEMEGAAVGQVCYEHDVPCVIVRAIADNANEESPARCMQFLKEAAAPYSKGILKNIYQNLDPKDPPHQKNR